MKLILLLILFIGNIYCQPTQQYQQAHKNLLYTDSIIRFINTDKVLIRIPSYLRSTKVDSSIIYGSFDMFLGEIKEMGYEWTGGWIPGSWRNPTHLVCKPLKSRAQNLNKEGNGQLKTTQKGSQ